MKTKILNNVDHSDLSYDPKLNSHRLMGGAIPIFINEVIQARKYYPILFYKTDQGVYKLAAITGFEKNENILVSNGDWQDNYVPLCIEKGPFSIIKNKAGDELQIGIDVSDVSITKEGDGQLFKESGGLSDGLLKIKTILNEIHFGLEQEIGFSNALIEIDLLEPAEIQYDVGGKNKHVMQGFYIINISKFNSLSKEELSFLYANAYLGILYAIIHSMDNFQKLVDLKNKRLI